MYDLLPHTLRALTSSSRGSVYNICCMNYALYTHFPREIRKAKPGKKKRCPIVQVPSALLILRTFGDSQFSLGTKDSFAGLKTAD